MATVVHSKRWSLILIPVVLLACLFLAIRRPLPAAANAISMKFVGYTNLPNNELRFALFSVSNQAMYAIRWHGDWVEVEGSPDHKGRIVSPFLPGCAPYSPVLGKGESLEFAVGDATQFGRWRFSMSFARYSLQERWFDFSRRHGLPLQLGPLVFVDSQRILSPSNHLIASTEWVTK